MDYRFLLISVCIGLVKCYSQNSYYLENHKYCDDLSPYFGDINLDQVTGVWYGVEKIYHAKGEYKIEHTHECFYIDIKEPFVEPTPPSPYGYEERIRLDYRDPSYMLTTSPYVSRAFGLPEQYRTRHFVLEWHEGLWKDDYHVKVNTSHKGFWPTDVPNGSVDKMYRFFGGVIQVLKVSHNYMVLNFCMRLPHSQLYSVILSRSENQLTPEDLATIHNIFTIKHLSTSSLKRVCSAATTHVSNLFVLALLLFTWRYLRACNDVLEVVPCPMRYHEYDKCHAKNAGYNS